MCGIGAAFPQENGDRPLVYGLKFEGNQYLEDVRLRASIRTTPSSAFARTPVVRLLGLGQKRYFSPRDLQQDLIRLLLLYRASGFFEARIDTVVSRSDHSVDVEFLIEEGPPVRVVTVQTLGADDILSRDDLSELPLQIGDPFDRLLLLATVDSIRAIVRNRGYPFAEVFSNFDENRVARVADVQFEVDPGPVAYVDSIEIQGPTTVDERVVRRMLSIREGDRFSERGLLESQIELYRIGVFDYVDVSLADSTYDSLDDSLVNIRVQVSEGRLQRIRGGFGYGTLDCIRTLASWTVRDFLGGGRTFDVTARLSKIGTGGALDFVPNGLCRQVADDPDPDRRKVNYDVTASILYPFVFSRRNSASISLSLERQSEIKAYLTQAVGGNLSFTRALSSNIRATTSYSLSRGRTDAAEATFCALLGLCTQEARDIVRDFRWRSILGLTVVRDRTNSIVNPTQGNRVSLDVRYADDAIGSDSLVQFVRWVAEAAWYNRIRRRTVFGVRLRMGGIRSPDLRFLGAPGQTVEAIPTDERFFAGGPNTVRGFAQNGLGPLVYVADSLTAGTDTTFSATGGNQIFLANAELRFPLPVFAGRLGGSVFVDAGDVFERGESSVPFESLRITPGVGVRLITPLGPIRFDLAYNGYDPRRGPLLVQQADSLVIADQNFAPGRGTGFFSRLRLNFAIGEAF